MRAANRLAPLVGAPLLSAALLGASATPSSAAPAPVALSAPAPSIASIPAGVQPFVAKIARQPVNSERYSTTATVAGTVTVERKGKRQQLPKHETKTSVGEASLAPLLGKLHVEGDPGEFSQIGIGSTIYTFAPKFAGKATGRPWMRSDDASAASLFPYHGQDNPAIEVNAGGTGPYAELINLLASAGGSVSVVGPATVNGQATTELTASIHPFALIQGVGASSSPPEPPVKLEVFLTDAGLPVRVIRSQQFGGISTTETTDVLATGVPVAVKAPPAGKTLSPAGVEKLFLRKGSHGKHGGRKHGGGSRKNHKA